MQLLQLESSSYVSLIVLNVISRVIFTIYKFCLNKLALGPNPCVKHESTLYHIQDKIIYILKILLRYSTNHQ